MIPLLVVNPHIILITHVYVACQCVCACVILCASAFDCMGILTSSTSLSSLFSSSQLCVCVRACACIYSRAPMCVRVLSRLVLILCAWMKICLHGLPTTQPRPRAHVPPLCYPPSQTPVCTHACVCVSLCVCVCTCTSMLKEFTSLPPSSSTLSCMCVRMRTCV